MSFDIFPKCTALLSRISRKENPVELSLTGIQSIRLKPISSDPAVMKGINQSARHHQICVYCKKYKQPSNAFFNQEYSQLNRFCKCVYARDFQKTMKFGTTSVVNMFSSLALSGLKAKRFNRQESLSPMNAAAEIAKERRLKYRFKGNITRQHYLAAPTLPYKFIIFPGNNSKLIQNLLEIRGVWEEVALNESGAAQFVWSHISQHIRFDRLVPYLPIQLVNHFEKHSELTNKMKFYSNIEQYCRKNGEDVASVMPITFELDFASNRFHSQYMSFLGFFKNSAKQIRKSELSTGPKTHSVGKNIYIMKPSCFNRGRGIHIFNELATFKDIISNYQGLLKGKSNEKEYQFIIQKYIENPLLFEGRKFDIRVWVLVTQEMNAYFFREGYLRTSSHPFSLDATRLSEESVHLTNNAIQKYGNCYGKFEEGNQLSFARFNRHLLGYEQNMHSLIEKIKKLIVISLQAVKGKLNPNKRQFSFEVFGYDFIVDAEFTPWLIECNTNPCLELSSPLLKQLIPKMLNGALKLTLDSLFRPEQKDESIVDENLWELLVSIKQNKTL